MRDVSQRLRRLLYLVPYVAREYDGVASEELANLLGIDHEMLMKDPMQILKKYFKITGGPKR